VKESFGKNTLDSLDHPDQTLSLSPTLGDCVIIGEMVKNVMLITAGHIMESISYETLGWEGTLLTKLNNFKKS
jgi:hypothetical protein